MDECADKWFCKAYEVLRELIIARKVELSAIDEVEKSKRHRGERR